jgi:MFS family permease
VRALLRGNVLWLSVVSLLNDTSSEMIYPLLPTFLVVSLGASPTFLGAVEGAAESVASLLKLASGWISDRWGRRPLVLTGYGLAAAVRPVIALAVAPWHILAIRLTDRTGKGIRSAARDALLAESVAPDVRGTAYGIHRSADHLGATVGPLIASGILFLLAGGVAGDATEDHLRVTFALAAIPAILAVAILAWKVREPRESRVVQAEPMATDTAPAASVFQGPFLRWLGVVLLFTLGNATDAFLLLRAQELGVPVAALPLLWSAHHATKTLFSVAGGVLSDRTGPRRAIALGWLTYAVTYGAFAFAGRAWHAWALFLLYGLFHALTEAPEKALVAKLAPEGRRGAAFGAYHAAIGIAALPAGILFGTLWTLFGAPVAFLTGAALSLAAALLLPITRERA